MDVLKRNNVKISGAVGGLPLVFAHGLGCNQTMWRHVAPAFEATHRVVLFDHVGFGASDLRAYDPERHATLHGYAKDVAEVLEAVDLREVTCIAHSVGGMIGVLASIGAARDRIGRLVLVAASPRYLDDPPDYLGGFGRADLDGLMHMMESNRLGWASFMAPIMSGAPDDDATTVELREVFCAADPYITRRLAAAALYADDRPALRQVTVPSLIVQCADDAITPRSVGDYVHAQVAGSVLRIIETKGHFPQLTRPQRTIELIREFLAATSPFGRAR